MIKNLACNLNFSILLVSCQHNFYNAEDYSLVLKLDSHVHLNSYKGYFEDQAMEDNFMLITLNVDHFDSASVKQQNDHALLSTQK